MQCALYLFPFKSVGVLVHWRNQIYLRFFYSNIKVILLKFQTEETNWKYLYKSSHILAQTCSQLKTKNILQFFLKVILEKLFQYQDESLEL